MNLIGIKIVDMSHIVVNLLNNQIFLGLLCFILIGVPIVGIWAIHKYNWQHWEPLDRIRKK
jgi:high-affinity Fe2+/Pb2+ permease